MHRLSQEAMDVLRQAAQGGQEIARRLLADLDGPLKDEDIYVPAVIREARMRRPGIPFD